MESLKELFKTGHGPSSSHTMGPQKAAEIFMKRNPGAVFYIVELYGSLAATGKGHLTDYIIKKTLGDNCEILFKPEIIPDYHTNGMKFYAYDASKRVIEETVFYSTGGGTIVEKGEKTDNKKEVYIEKSFKEISEWCNENKKGLAEYVEHNEGKEIWDYLKSISEAMEKSVENGLKADGILPGDLKLERKAKQYHEKYKKLTIQDKLEGRLYSYALAVSEENAAGEMVVTAPTCGSCGIIPSLIKAYKAVGDMTTDEVTKALGVAGIIGNLAKQNASISGAEVGCQGEIGVACSMGAAMVAYILNGTLEQI